jgi:hypothetical protein
VRIVQELPACQDLHPSCAAWQTGGKCNREPKAMLELCQVWSGHIRMQLHIDSLRCHLGLSVVGPIRLERCRESLGVHRLQDMAGNLSR